ncbi:MAG: response regulator [Lachnospiraceae bacterium]|nr:response regulator [Lachnospiraceae bacterium]
MKGLRLFSTKERKQFDIRLESFRFILVLMIALPVLSLVISVSSGRKINVYVSSIWVVSIFLGTLFLYLLQKFGALRMLFVLTVCYINFVVMPVLIFYGARSSAGIPLWITGGLMLMFLLLEFKDLWWLFLVSVYFETVLYVRFYLWETRTTQSQGTLSFLSNYVLAFGGIALALIVVLLLQERNFRISEVQIDKSREVEKAAGAAKSRFLANMSHEIRTPMNSIIGLSELILKEDMADATRNEVTLIKQSAYDLLDIIDDVLVYAKLDSGKMKEVKADFAFRDLLKQIMESVNGVGIQSYLKTHVEVDHNIPRLLRGDDILIRQIIMRLMYISISMTDNGRLILKINCVRDKNDKVAHFTFVIGDTGVGLSQADLNAIYGVYNTYDSKQNSNLKGIGLKFNICRELLMLMGGSMEVQSIDGIGLKSEVKFDCEIVDPAPMIEVMDSNRKKVLIFASENRELSVWKSIMEGFRILPDYVNSYFGFERTVSKKSYDYVFVPAEDYPAVSNIIESYKLSENTYVVSGPDRTYGDFDKCRLIYHPVSSLTIADILNNKWKAEDYAFKDDMSYDGNKAKILVVDDNSVNLKVAAGIFKAYNIDIDIAKSGDEALKKIRNIKYDIVFMDLIMPEMSGTEALHRLRGLDSPSVSNVPVIALTANAGGNIRDEILAEGFQEYLAKPIKQKYLLKCLTDFLSPDIFKRVAKKQENKEETRDITAEENILDVAKGISNIGNNKDSYCAILNTYYSEGLRKIEALPNELEAGDISLFTTDVHGIKSSSASIGAMAVSAMFKELENAGKQSDLDYIHRKYDTYLEAFKKILSDVKDYLLSEGQFAYKEESLDASIKDMEVEAPDKEALLVLKDLIDRMDLKTADPIVAELCAHNYGDEINFKTEKLKKAYDMFDFHEVKAVLSELI